MFAIFPKKKRVQVLVDSIDERDALLPKEIALYSILSVFTGLLSVYLTTEGTYNLILEFQSEDSIPFFTYYFIFFLLLFLISIRNVVLEIVATHTKSSKNITEAVKNTLLNRNSSNAIGQRLFVGIIITIIFFIGDYFYIKNKIENFKNKTTTEIVKKDRKLDYLDKKIKEAQNKLKELKNLRAEYIPNSKSIYKAKRESALRAIDKIDAKIEKQEKKINDLTNQKLTHLQNVDNRVEDKSKYPFFIALFFAIALESFGVMNVLRANILSKESQASEEIVRVENEKKKIDFEEVIEALSTIRYSSQQPIPNINNAYNKIEEQPKTNINNSYKEKEEEEQPKREKKIGFITSPTTTKNIATTIATIDKKHRYDVATIKREKDLENPNSISGGNIATTIATREKKHRSDVTKMIKTKEELIRELWKNGKVKRGQKLTPKTEIIDVKDWKNEKKIREIYKELKVKNAVKLKTAQGYFALTEMEEVLKKINTKKE